MSQSVETRRSSHPSPPRRRVNDRRCSRSLGGTQPFAKQAAHPKRTSTYHLGGRSSTDLARAISTLEKPDLDPITRRFGGPDYLGFKMEGRVADDWSGCCPGN